MKQGFRKNNAKEITRFITSLLNANYWIDFTLTLKYPRETRRLNFQVLQMVRWGPSTSLKKFKKIGLYGKFMLEICLIYINRF